MIRQHEIQAHSRLNGVPVRTIDKDWMLSHFLNAMYSFDSVKENFIFKGGTCLRKNYYPNYRFSEDLDFTLLDDSFSCDKKEIGKWIRKAQKSSGARLHFYNIKEQHSGDIPQGYEIKIKFWGANHKTNQKPPPSAQWHDTIKLDITFTEKLLDEPNIQAIHHPYSDKEAITQLIPTYSIVEILSEKLRSLIQRNRPRDVYDIWFLYNNTKSLDYCKLLELLIQKAKNKDIEFSTSTDFVNDDKKLINNKEWQSSLGHHLPQKLLPAADDAYADVTKFVNQVLKSKR